MALPSDFQFSQGSLQDYVDCPRRFRLRYVQQVAWPAVETEPVLEHERYLQQGVAFHRLAHQHALGVPVERLTEVVVGEDLNRWWRNYLESSPADLPPSRHPEIVLSAPLGGYRLLARYDLIALVPRQRAVIVDWKTSRRRTRRDWLAERLQTRVHPYLLVQAGAHLNEGQTLEPGQVEMLYWFTDFPADPERFNYDAVQYEADGEYLVSLIDEIADLDDAEFPLTANERHCRFCSYRSLCRRGVEAGLFDELEDEREPGDDISLDFDQIAEIVYF